MVREEFFKFIDDFKAIFEQFQFELIEIGNIDEIVKSGSAITSIESIFQAKIEQCV